MIDSLIKMFNKELSYKYLVYRHLTLKEKLLDLFPFIYLFVLFFSAIVAIIGPRLRWILILPLYLFLDFFLIKLKPRVSLISYLEKKRLKMVMAVFRDRNDVKNKCKSFSKSFEKYKKREVRKYLKSYDPVIALECIRYKESRQLTMTLFFAGAFILMASEQIAKTIEKIPFYKDFNIQFQEILDYSNNYEPKYGYVLFAFIALAIMLGLISIFFKAVPYIFFKSYMDIKSSKLKSLRVLVEDIAMKKK
ncbi:hypothetical protein PY092_16600 [Muricauda sp. 334s03]|uniref:Uncharacterized protein n=1 Tax=Flagellimonas yonaguniensis TaxID=3031325 RepID=A0ABT5Y2V2_9FLAO|nr:hypothetical protein [[Muricauda] yonaguniensis]MDF0717785.1 hypothetical protein [[Muricauda] yonaguniensis]